MECQYCKKNFSSKQSLNTHQKTTIYCLKLQGKNEEVNNFNCNYCDKIFTTKQYLLTHLSYCKDKDLQDKLKEKDKELQDKLKEKDRELQDKLKEKDRELQDKLKEKDKELQDKLKEKDIIIMEYREQIAVLKGQLITLKDDHEFIKEIAKQPKTTTTTTNTTHNTLNIASFIDFNDIDKIKDTIENKLNINHIVDGQKGLANFVKDTLLTDENGKLLYVCTDASRHIFKYKDSSGEIKKDVEAKKLTNYILDGGIRTKSAVIGNDWFTDEKGDIDMNKYNIILDQQQNIMKLRDDNNSFKRELASITS